MKFYLCNKNLKRVNRLSSKIRNELMTKCKRWKKILKKMYLRAENRIMSPKFLPIKKSLKNIILNKTTLKGYHKNQNEKRPALIKKIRESFLLPEKW